MPEAPPAALRKAVPGSWSASAAARRPDHGRTMVAIAGRRIEAVGSSASKRVAAAAARSCKGRLHKREARSSPLGVGLDVAPDVEVGAGRVARDNEHFSRDPTVVARSSQPLLHLIPRHVPIPAHPGRYRKRGSAPACRRSRNRLRQIFFDIEMEGIEQDADPVDPAARASVQASSAVFRRSVSKRFRASSPSVTPSFSSVSLTQREPGQTAPDALALAGIKLPPGREQHPARPREPSLAVVSTAQRRYATPAAHTSSSAEVISCAGDSPSEHVTSSP